MQAKRDITLNYYGLLIKKNIFLIAVFFISNFAFAGTGVTYHGRLLKPDNTPMESNSVQFKMQVRSTGAEDCLLYEETQTHNMNGSDGAFSITLNDGSGTRTDTTGYSFENVFSNGSAFALPTQCAVGVAWSPAASSGRKMVVSFKDASMMAFENMPTQSLNFVPQAIEAQRIAGLVPANLLQVDTSGTVQLTQSNLAAAFTGTAYTNLQKILAGSFVNTTTGAGAGLPTFAADPGTPAVGSIWYNSTSNTLKYYDGSVKTLGTSGAGIGGLTGTSDITMDGVAAGSLSAAGTVGLSNTGVSVGSYPKVAVDAKGRVTAGYALSESDIPALTTAGKVSGNAIDSGTIGGSAAINISGAIATSSSVTSASMATRTFDLYDTDNTNRIRFLTPATGVLTADYNLVFPADAGTSGYVLATDGSGNLSWVNRVATNDARMNPAPIVADALKIVRQNALGDGYEVVTAGAIMSAGNAFIQDGNSFTATATLGTNDANALRLETNNVARIHVDATGNVGIGTTSPDVKLSVVANSSAIPSPLSDTLLRVAGADGADTRVTIDSFGSGNGVLSFRAAENTAAAPSAIPVNRAIGNINFLGYGGTGYSSSQRAYIKVHAAENWTNGAQGTYFVFGTTTAGTTPVAERMRISGSGYVGIGTTNPGANLEVKDAIRIGGSTSGYVGFQAPAAAGSTTYILPSADGAAGAVLATDGTGTLSWATAGTVTTSTVGSGSAASPSMTFSGDANTGFYSAGADQVGISVGGANIFTIDASGVVSPTTGGASVATANGTASYPTYSFAGDTDTGWFRPAADTMAAATGGSERIRIDPSGYIGIGTTAPSSLLEVSMNGTANTMSNYPAIKITNTNPTQGDGVTNFNFASMRIGAGNGVVSGDMLAAYSSVGVTDGLYLRTTTNHPLYFRTNNSNRMVIDTSGNVGMGTISPAAPTVANGVSNLDVIGSGRFFRQLQINSAGSFPQAPKFQITYGGTELVRLQGDLTNTGSNTSSQLSFWTTNADVIGEAMRIRANGYVGIGTTNPGASLEVKDAIRIGGSTSGYVGLKAAAAAGSTTYTLPSADGSAGAVLSTNGTGTLSWTTSPTMTTATVGSGTAASPSLTFSGDSDTGFYSVGANQIGIAASGASIFTVGASGIVSTTTGGASVSTANGTAAAPTFSFAGDTDTGWFRPAADTIAVATSGAERMRIDPSGNVGIGTSAPNYALTVNGSVVAGPGALAGPAYMFYPTATYGATGMYAPAANTVGLVTGGAERMRIDPSGNVGIGTTASLAKLTVTSNTGTLPNSNATVQIAAADASNTRLTLDAFGGTNEIAFRRANGTSAAKSEVALNDPIGVLNWYGTYTATNYTGITKATFGAYAAETWATGAQGTYFAFSPTPISGSSVIERVRITDVGRVGIGTTTPRGPLHIAEGGNGSYTFIQGGMPNGNGTAFTPTDTIPVLSNAGGGPIGYNGLVLMPNEWGGTTADQHNMLYLGGAQRSSGGIATTLAFGNWGYFSGTGAGAGELGNATAQGDAAKFWMQLVDGGSEFTQRLDTVARSATGTNTYAMSVVSSGYVGIGTTNPSFTLDVAGSARATGSVASWSDIRVKKEIRALDDSLEKIMNLNGVSFEWRNDEFPEKKFKQGRDVGVIAQNVETQFPEVVETAPDGYKSVAYQKLVAPLIEAVKTLYKRLVGVEDRQIAQDQRIKSLEEENAKLKAYLCQKDPAAPICK